ncbi:maleylacetoacetate isomerase [Azospirillum canadense]|uniref:maleylacetoacetate isomerase n=1 Tax=Azospirillum canadense TaxID=403962 RepID=UPI0022264A0D|nr:maleylacetoacetate isomerase [Azospirillum canadense]MCW2242439.1 maleylpyruvate isomerase [Azospirillum canadense]
MILYDNGISSAASRVRIALALKGVDVVRQPVSIFGPDAGSRQAGYLRVNPQGLVPTLLTDDGTLLTQSLAIIEYLDEAHPEPPLLPRNLKERAFARSVALAIASETHALLPPRVAARLTALPGVDEGAITDWKRHWVSEGLSAVETLIGARRTGPFVVGSQPTLADIVLFPQALTTDRVGLDIRHWPNIAEIVSTLRGIPAFADNAPGATQ